MAIAIPLVARLYGAAAVGQAGVAIAVTAMLTPFFIFGTGELVQGAPADRAVRLLKEWLTVCCAISFVVAIGLALGFSFEWIDRQMLYLLTALFAQLLVTSALPIVIGVRTRFGHFSVIGKQRAITGIATASFQTALGFLWPSTTSLVTAQVLGTLSGLTYLTLGGPSLWSMRRRALDQPSHRLPPGTVKQRIDALFGRLPQIAALQAPILIAGVFYSAASVGQVVLAVRLLSIPNTYLGIGRSYSFQHRVAEMVREKRAGISEALGRNSQAMWRVSLPVYGIVFVGSYFSTLLFGTEFTSLGSVIRVLTPSFLLQTVNAPLIPFLLIVGASATFRNAMLARLALSAIAASAVGFFGGGLTLAMGAYSAGAALANIWIMSQMRRKARRADRSVS
jgi:O-antigen/teichoic acid export membrane protein